MGVQPTSGGRSNDYIKSEYSSCPLGQYFKSSTRLVVYTTLNNYFSGASSNFRQITFDCDTGNKMCKNGFNP